MPIDDQLIDEIVRLAVAADEDQLRALLGAEADGYRALATWSDLTRNIDAAREDLERYERTHKTIADLPDMDNWPTCVLARACPMTGPLVCDDGWGRCDGCHTELDWDERQRLYVHGAVTA